MAARRAVELGMDVPEAVASSGVTDPRIVSEVERHAVETLDMDAMRDDVELDEIVEWWGIRDPANVELLKDRLVQLEVQRGSNIPEVLARYGKTSATLRAELELVAVHGPGTTAVEQGRDVKDVAEGLGITDDKHIETLRGIAATSAAKRGEDLRNIIAREGITSQEDISRLEFAAVSGPGRNAVLAGDDPAEVADRLGILSPANIARLYNFADSRDEGNDA